jgi:hypothetical protein
MAFFLRVLSFPPLTQITAIPQIVVIDRTGPTISFGTQPGAACLVGEFTAGLFVPTEVFSQQDVTSQYTGDGKVYPYFSQDGSATPIQNGTQVGYNGNGMLQLLSKTFQRLILQRVDHEAVTLDQGTAKATLSVTVTVAVSDQDGSGNTNKDIVIPAGARFGDAVFGSATRVFGASGNTIIPAGTALTSNQVTVQVPCFPIRVVEPVVATAIAAVATVIDPVLQNVAATTLISGVNNSTALWPQGVGTTLALRLESQYAPAIAKTLPTNAPMDAITIIWAARRSSIIRQALAQNANDSSANSPTGRIAIVAADPAANATSGAASAAVTAAIGLASSDNYVQPADRVVICFPMTKIFVPDFGVKVVTNSDGWMATTLSNFAEEVNPGAQNAYIQSIVELEDAFIANPLLKPAHTALIAGGVAAIRHDTNVGWEFVQGVTAANKVTWPTRVRIQRRRMADLIEGTLAQLAAPYLKGPATVENVDAFVGAIHSFMDSLKSPDLPAAQRIVDYFIDEKSENTQVLNSQGVFVYKVYAQTLPSQDYIVFDTQIGETVVIPNPVAAAA